MKAKNVIHIVVYIHNVSFTTLNLCPLDTNFPRLSSLCVQMTNIIAISKGYGQSQDC